MKNSTDRKTEQQFILRVPTHLKSEIDSELSLHGKPNCIIDTTKDYKFIFKGVCYDIHAVKIPTLLESLKTFDEKQFYKSADISTMFVVGDKPTEEIISSGITPPMRFVKHRRFRKQKVIEELGDNVELMVKGLLERDRAALEVNIQYHSNEMEERETEIIAGEIEAGLEEVKGVINEVVEEVKVEEFECEIDLKIKEMKEKVENCANPILKKRFKATLDDLIAEKEKKGHK